MPPPKGPRGTPRPRAAPWPAAAPLRKPPTARECSGVRGEQPAHAGGRKARGAGPRYRYAPRVFLGERADHALSCVESAPRRAARRLEARSRRHRNNRCVRRRRGGLPRPTSRARPRLRYKQSGKRLRGRRHLPPRPLGGTLWSLGSPEERRFSVQICEIAVGESGPLNKWYRTFAPF